MVWFGLVGLGLVGFGMGWVWVGDGIARVDGWVGLGQPATPEHYAFVGFGGVGLAWGCDSTGGWVGGLGWDHRRHRNMVLSLSWGWGRGSVGDEIGRVVGE